MSDRYCIVCGKDDSYVWMNDTCNECRRAAKQSAVRVVQAANRSGKTDAVVAFVDAVTKKMNEGLAEFKRKNPMPPEVGKFIQFTPTDLVADCFVSEEAKASATVETPMVYVGSLCEQCGGDADSIDNKYLCADCYHRMIVNGSRHLHKPPTVPQPPPDTVDDLLDINGLTYRACLCRGNAMSEVMAYPDGKVVCMKCRAMLLPVATSVAMRENPIKARQGHYLKKRGGVPASEVRQPNPILASEESLRLEEKKAELWTLARKFMARRGSWPACPECHRNMEVTGIDSMTILLRCPEDTHPQYSPVRFIAPEKLRGLNVSASEIPASLGGTLVSREDHAAKAKTVVRRGKR